MFRRRFSIRHGGETIRSREPCRDPLAILSGGPCGLLSLTDFRGWQPHHDASSCPCVIGTDFEAAAQLAHPFPHPSHAYSDRAARLHLVTHLGRYSFAMIHYFQPHVAVQPGDLNCGRGAARVPMNIYQAFLHDSKNGCFHLSREPSEILAALQVHSNLTSLSKSLDIPREGGRKSHLIQ
jgi:hypothetical protein